MFFLVGGRKFTDSGLIRKSEFAVTKREAIIHPTFTTLD
jgi:hypothetical protein